MRQPTNLRGATLPGLSQPSEKEGPHHRSFWLPRLQRQADSLSFCLVVEGPGIWGFERQQSTAPLSGWQGSPSLFRAGAATSSRPGITDRPAGFFSSLCVCGWFCWFCKVSDSVWELVATETEAWHLNCPGNMTARCSVGHINHSKLGADMDMNLAGDHWPGSEIPQISHYFPVAWVLKMRG